MSVVREALRVLEESPGKKFCLSCWALRAGLDADQPALLALAHLYPEITGGEASCAVCGTNTRVFAKRLGP